MAKILTRCPVCESSMSVTELACGRCQTSVRGTFVTCRFCRLPVDQLQFVETFLRNEGNLSRVGAALGLSYPTVRNKLVAAIRSLGLDVEPAVEETPHPVDPLDHSPQSRVMSPESVRRSQARLELLEALEEGALSIEEVAQAIRDI